MSSSLAWAQKKTGFVLEKSVKTAGGLNQPLGLDVEGAKFLLIRGLFQADMFHVSCISDSHTRGGSYTFLGVQSGEF